MQAQPWPACCQSVQEHVEPWCAQHTDSPITCSILSFGGWMNLRKYNLFFRQTIIFPLKRVVFISVSFWPATLVLCLRSFSPEVFSVVLWPLSAASHPLLTAFLALLYECHKRAEGLGFECIKYKAMNGENLLQDTSILSLMSGTVTGYVLKYT